MSAKICELLVDSRERAIIPYINSPYLKIVNNMQVGDYNIAINSKMVLTIERKTLADYASSMKDGRMNNKLKQLILRGKTGCQIMYIIEMPNRIPDIISGVPYSAIKLSIMHLRTQYGIHIERTHGMLGTATLLAELCVSYMNRSSYEPINFVNLETLYYSENLQGEKQWFRLVPCEAEPVELQLQAAEIVNPHAGEDFVVCDDEKCQSCKVGASAANVASEEIKTVKLQILNISPENYEQPNFGTDLLDISTSLVTAKFQKSIKQQKQEILLGVFGNATAAALLDVKIADLIAGKIEISKIKLASSRALPENQVEKIKLLQSDQLREEQKQLLAGIQGISAESAAKILHTVGNLKKLCKMNEIELRQIKGVRISANVAKAIVQFLAD